MLPIEAVQAHTITSYGGIVAILIAIYLAMVVYQGNTQELMIQLGTEYAFLKWGIALIILWVIIQETPGSLGSSIGMLAFFALVLVAGSKVFPQVQNFFTK